MISPKLAVLDASVGVKWIKREAGSDEAFDLLAQHKDVVISIVVPSHFVHEVVATAVRHGGASCGEEAWENLQAAELTVLRLDEALARTALAFCRTLGCSFYDALAPALAEQLGATLISADRRAHAEFPGVSLIGCD